MPILWTESELPLLPAEPWALEAAIEALAAGPEGGGLARAAQGWLEPRPLPSGRVKGVRGWLREAGDAALLTPQGSGWEAGYRPRQGWLGEVAALRAELDRAEVEVLAGGAQCLVAMSTMLWKKAAA
jgi:hypothetical protein